MALAFRNPTSVLGIDCGSTFTKVALIEQVEGRYRLIARGKARTTTDTHIFDGISRACSQIEELTGRRLSAHGEPVAGEVAGNRGVEALAVSITCQPALQVLATNLDAAAAAERGLCEVTRFRAPTVRERLEQAQAKEWHAIVGTGQEIAEVAFLLPRQEEPNEADPSAADIPRSRAGKSSGPHAALLPRHISGDATTIERELNALSIDQAARSIPGMAELIAASTEPVCTGPTALTALARVIAQRFHLRLAIADCGAAVTTLVAADLAAGVVDLRRRENVQRDFPGTVEELKRCHRLAEEGLGQLMPGLSSDLLVGTGGVFSAISQWGQAALILLNGIRPSGVIQLAVDSAGILSQLAPLAEQFPDVVSEAMENDGLTSLGTAICPQGSAVDGQKALDLSWRTGQAPESRATIAAGELRRIPLGLGATAGVNLFPSGSLDIGLGRHGAPASTQVNGGRVGLIVDARLGTLAGEDGRFEHWQQTLEAYV